MADKRKKKKNIDKVRLDLIINEDKKEDKKEEKKEDKNRVAREEEEDIPSFIEDEDKKEIRGLEEIPKEEQSNLESVTADFFTPKKEDDEKTKPYSPVGGYEKAKTYDGKNSGDRKRTDFREEQTRRMPFSREEEDNQFLNNGDNYEPRDPVYESNNEESFNNTFLDRKRKVF